MRRKVIGTTMAMPPTASMTTEGHDRVDGAGATARSAKGSQEQEQEQLEEQQLRPGRKTAAGQGSGETIKSKNRRSRSMDDLFDDDDRGQGVECDFLDNTQSMETLLGSDRPHHRLHEPPAGSPPESPGATEELQEVRSMGGNVCFNRRFVHDDEPAEAKREEAESLSTSHEQLCENETITVDSTPRLAQAEETEPEEDVQSTHSSATSSHGSGASSDKGPKKAPKPLINRYVKKVKSLMKM